MLNPETKSAINHVRLISSGPPVPKNVHLTINFHPDTLYGNGLMIEALARKGFYSSQFETKNSNGGLSAYPGGDRWNWESRIFGAVYDEARPALRPKYGALNYLGHETGGSPRFGSCHLRLASHLLPRATFCYPDSYFEPADFGVADRLGLISLAERERPKIDTLDSYIEAHVHGPLDLAVDVEAIVLDPSYRETEIETAAAALKCPVEWHSGFRMPQRSLQECVDYRGAKTARLAESLLENGVLTPRLVGLARQASRADQKLLKRVWHCVAKFGSPLIPQV